MAKKEELLFKELLNSSVALAKDIMKKEVHKRSKVESDFITALDKVVEDIMVNNRQQH